MGNALDAVLNPLRKELDVTHKGNRVANPVGMVALTHYFTSLRLYTSWRNWLNGIDLLPSATPFAYGSSLKRS